MAEAAAQETATAAKQANVWEGGKPALGASFGKVMMWFFILSDAFTFAGLLISYGLIRFGAEFWPDPDTVFDAAPFIGHGNPLVFVGIMTFILIISSLTMVLAVEEGHKLNKGKTAFWLFLTVLGGFTFLGCQAWEWNHLLSGSEEHHIAPTTIYNNPWGPIKEGVDPSEVHGTQGREAGPIQFSQFFFVITGFHGFHVTTGVILNIIILVLTIKGTMQRKGNYELVEKVGLYWHFVDLVWVFVFTFFYLV